MLYRLLHYRRLTLSHYRFYYTIGDFITLSVINVITLSVSYYTISDTVITLLLLLLLLLLVFCCLAGH